MCAGGRSWNIENGVRKNKLLGVPNKIELGDTKLSFTQQFDLNYKCRVTKTLST